MTTMHTTVTVTADPDADDCLSAAAESYIEDHPELEGYDLDPQWENEDDRTYVVLIVPSSVASLTPDQAWDGFVGSQSTSEFVDAGGEPAEYVEHSPTCAHLSQAERETLAEKLAEHISENS
jgi:hypothetical protein